MHLHERLCLRALNTTVDLSKMAIILYGSGHGAILGVFHIIIVMDYNYYTQYRV